MSSDAIEEEQSHLEATLILSPSMHTRNVLIHDEKNLSRITKKPSLCSICDGFRERHGLSVMD